MSRRSEVHRRDRIRVVADCGGTSSRVQVIVDRGADSEIVGRFDTGASLTGYLDPSEVGDTMRRVLAPAASLCRTGGLESMPVTVAIAAAGFTDGLRTVYRRAAGRVVAEGFGGAVEKVLVVNDAVALLLGHDADGVVVAGTGSSVLLLGAGGRPVQAGGHDWVAGDEGSAFWVGMVGLRCVARAVDEDRASVLRAACGRLYGVDDVGIPGVLRDLAIAGPEMKSKIARFAVGVYEASDNGDREAEAVLRGQSAALADTVARAMRRAEIDASKPLQMIGCGGMLTVPTYRTLVQAAVAEAAPEVSVHWRIVDDGLAAAAAIAAHHHASSMPLGTARPVIVSADATHDDE